MTEANRCGCGGVRARGRGEEGPHHQDPQDLEIATMGRRIRKLERRLAEAWVASANREEEEESDIVNSSEVGVEGKDYVDDFDPFDGPPIYDVYPDDEADLDFFEASPEAEFLSGYSTASLKLEPTKTDLVHAYVCLPRDNEAEVRIAAARRVTKFCRIVDPELAIQNVLPCVKELSSDSSQHVRSALASVIMGMAHVLGKDATIEKDKEMGIAEVVSRWTGIPVTHLGQNDKERLVALADRLHKRVVGQDQAVEAVAEAVLRSRAGLGWQQQPTGSFLFLGLTGVGKLELAKALTDQLFDGENLLVRFDMSEYMEQHFVARLIGAPPSYVDHEEGGQLTEAIRRRSYIVVLFVEVEKAHLSVFSTLLQVLDVEVSTWIEMFGFGLHSKGDKEIWMFDPGIIQGEYNVSDSRTNLFLEGENGAIWMREAMRERAHGLDKADSGLDGPIRYYEMFSRRESRSESNPWLCHGLRSFLGIRSRFRAENSNFSISEKFMGFFVISYF